jgi:hypothetical protein
MEFLEGINQYDSIKGYSRNTINYDIEKDLISRVKELFNLDLLNVKSDFDIESIYSNNKAKYENRLEGEQISKELGTQFLYETPKLESLLYFEDEIENLIIRLKEWVSVSNSGSPSNSNSVFNIDSPSNSNRSAKNRLSIGGYTFLYNDYRDLSNQLKTNFDNGGFQINLSKVTIKKADIHDRKNGRGNSSTKYSEKQKDDLGFFGEFLVYIYLCKTINDKESVKWVSEYAKLAEVNLDGKDGKGYDIEYIPNSAKNPRYVEVKVVGRDNSFHITSTEIKAGERLKGHYEIFMVRNITDNGNISIEIIQGPFDYKGQGSFNDNKLFIVLNDSFILKFEKTN